jgi:hypothetical protein
MVHSRRDTSIPLPDPRPKNAGMTWIDINALPEYSAFSVWFRPIRATPCSILFLDFGQFGYNCKSPPALSLSKRDFRGSSFDTPSTRLRAGLRTNGEICQSPVIIY